MPDGGVHEGASIVKWTTFNPCKSVSKLYTNFEFCERKSINIYRTNDWQSHVICVDNDNDNFKKHIRISEDDASGVQVGDTEQIIVYLKRNYIW